MISSTISTMWSMEKSDLLFMQGLFLSQEMSSFMCNFCRVAEDHQVQCLREILVALLVEAERGRELAKTIVGNCQFSTKNYFAYTSLELLGTISDTEVMYFPVSKSSKNSTCRILFYDCHANLQYIFLVCIAIVD